MAQHLIRHRINGGIIYTGVADSLSKAVETAVQSGTSFASADLAGLDLSNANLQGGNFTDANLTAAKLDGCNLRGANMTNANLTKASLKEVLSGKLILTGATTTGFVHQSKD